MSATVQPVLPPEETPVEDILIDVSHPRTLQQYLRLFLSGFAMGSADVVPGISGGTMAFILGVYETLIDSIKSFNLDALRLLLAGRLGALVDHINLRFLVALGLGLGLALLLLANLLEGWIIEYPTWVFAFFAGLIVASIIALGHKVRRTSTAVVAFIIGAVVAFVIVGLPSVGDQLGHGPVVLFFSGMVAICAMILPGISGSFILLILGQYQFILGAVRSRDIVSIAATGVGAVIGILAFSRVLSWLLRRYENTTIAALVGFMAGSLRLILHRALYAVDAVEADAVERAVELNAGLIVVAVVLALVGFFVVTIIDHMQNRDNPVMLLLGWGGRRAATS